MTSGVGAGAAGPRVPGLRLLGPLRAGRCGQVWWAVDEGSGEAVSVEVSPAATLAQLDTGAGRAAAAVSRQIAVLRRLQHPHVLALRQVVDLPDGGRAVVSDHADGADLVQVLTARGALSPGEVTTVIVPIAQALAAIHRGGLVHGDVAAASVLFSRGGRPLLAGVGSPVLCGLTSQVTGDPQGDVAGLAHLGLACLRGSAAGEGDSHAILTEVLQAYARGAGRSGDVDDPGGLAMALARSVYAAAPPVPLEMPAPPPVPEASPLPSPFSRLDPGAAALPGVDPRALDEATRLRPGGPASAGPVPDEPTVVRGIGGLGVGGVATPSPSGSSSSPWPASPAAAAPALRVPSDAAPRSAPTLGRRARPARPAVLLTVLGLLLALTVGVVSWRGRAGTSPAAQERPAAQLTPAEGARRPSGSASAPGPQDAVARLADLRQAALSAGDVQALSAVDVEGSPALAADRTLLRQLQERGERPVGARTRVLGTVLASWRSGEAVVEVRSKVEAHVLERTDGRPPVSVPEAAPTTVRLVLRPGGPVGWRIWAVEPT